MISKINIYAMVVVLFALFSCKKVEIGSDLKFSPTCNFSGSNVEVVNKLNGSLKYTDKVSNVAMLEYKFVIESSGRLPMIVCNMPVTFEMAENQSVNVTLSGRVITIPNEADAINTEIELSYLKFE